MNKKRNVSYLRLNTNNYHTRLGQLQILLVLIMLILSTGCVVHTVYHLYLDFILLLRYVYRFVCDLQELVGCSAEQLHRMLDIQPDAEEK